MENKTKEEKRAEKAALVLKQHKLSKSTSHSTVPVADDDYVEDGLDAMEAGANSTLPTPPQEPFSKSLSDDSTSYTDAVQPQLKETQEIREHYVRVS